MNRPSLRDTWPYIVPITRTRWVVSTIRVISVERRDRREIDSSGLTGRLIRPGKFREIGKTRAGRFRDDETERAPRD